MQALILCVLFLAAVSCSLSQDEYDRTMLRQMNSIRVERGIAPLRYHGKLDSVARSWIRHIVDSLSSLSDRDIMHRVRKDRSYLHIDFDDRALKLRFFPPLRLIVVGENVAISCGGIPDDPTQTAFNAWKDSRSHFEAMINDEFTHFGYEMIMCPDERILYITVFARVL